MRKWIALLVMVGCTKSNPSATCTNGMCSDPNFPFCDVDGAIDGEANACIAVTCTPGDFGACDGSNELVCNAAGSGFDSSACDTGCSAASNGCNGCVANTDRCTTTGVEHCGSDGKVSGTDVCAAGCVDTPMPHCAYISPKYLPDICDTPATDAKLDIINDEMFDADNDANCNGGVVAQGAPPICVVRYQTITVEQTATLTVVSSVNAQGNGGGSGGRAIAFVADQSLTIDGVLDASANFSVSGPGGGILVSGAPVSGGSGGGGAGFKTAGGTGGGATDGGGGAGGMAMQDPSSLTSFSGGPSSVLRGGGGGGVMLVACRGSVVVNGTAAVNGGGGEAGALVLAEPSAQPSQVVVVVACRGQSRAAGVGYLDHWQHVFERWSRGIRCARSTDLFRPATPARTVNARTATLQSAALRV